MTTPNQFFPDSSANYGGLAAFAAKSIEDWRNEVTGGFISATTLVQDAIQNFITFISQIPVIGPIASAALQYLQDLIDNAGQATAAAVGTLIANLSTMLTQIGDIFDGVVVTPINTVVQQIKDWWTATGVDLPTAITNAGNAVGDIADIISNAAQSTAAQVGAALAGAVDGIDDVVATALGTAGAAATSFGQAFEGALAGWVNAIQGGSLAAANAAQFTAAATALTGTVSSLSAQMTSINGQLSGFYGGGTGGLQEQVLISDPESLPSGYSAVTTIAIASAKHTTAAATDVQTAGGSWAVDDGRAKYLFLRANSGFTTYTYVLLKSNTPGGGANCKIGCVVSGTNTVLKTFSLPGAGRVVTNSAYLISANGYDLTVTGPGLSESVNDSGHVSQIGSSYRYGGFGSDGHVREIAYYSGGSGTYSYPSWFAVGDLFDVVAVGGGGGGAGGAALVHGNGGNAGSWDSDSLRYGDSYDIPTATTSFAISVGAGGSSGIVGGGSGGNAGSTTVTISGVGTITGSGGAGGVGTGGDSNGDSPGSTTVDNTQFNGGATQTAQSGYGYGPGGGGAGGRQGDFASPPGHGGGGGASGGIWIAAYDMTIPGALTSFAFYDTTIVGPATAYVATDQTTTSTSYVDLATATDTVTVDVGPSGMVLVNLHCQIYNDAQKAGFVSFAMSGANTMSAQDKYCLHMQMSGAGWTTQTAGTSFLLTGLNAGSTTFKMKYRAGSSGGTAHFGLRHIAVIPL
ncbi:hypothetical protein LAUMK4_05825 [Mycobacterium persicum]|uniref:Glycine-rich domain-containing protein n=1 Tax=Mycobacterium persicum TaxID=1487726 RepID=A0ABY6RSG6_9MYCO|nr:hypothetical protein [Mycobacterium persicum]ORB93949.1 hypothetical protein B1T44_04740 [Mycobacterium persicum]VBA32911.1 hypothetical protein LAUMK4_05825 [Mycobacterium persicum]